MSGATPGVQAADARARGSLKLLGELWQFVRPYGWPLAGAMVALLIASGTVLGLGMGLRRLVDDGFAAGDAGPLNQAVLVLFGVVILLALAIYARFYLVSWIGERVVADIRRKVFDHILTLSPAYYELTRTGEVLSRLTTDTTLLQTVVGSSVSIAIRNFLLLIGGTVLLVITSPKLTLLVFLVVPLVLLPILTFGRRVRRLSRTTQDRVADLGVYAGEALDAIRTVQAFVHEDEDRRRFGQRVEHAFEAARQRIAARAMLTAVVIVLVFGAVSTILWIGGHDVLSGRISAGELSAFVFYAIVVAGAAGAFSEVIGDLQRAAGATERLLDLLAVEPDITAPAKPAALPSPPRGAVAFEAVAFHYPSRPEHSALQGLDFSVAPGERVAIVGPSGAGKTTIFQLLLRFYDPQGGTIRFDGVALPDVDPAALRARIGLVPQEPVVFSASALENIRYGRPDASDEEVRAAAVAAGALEFIERLPEGFDTYLGEKGVRLSGGQRQRIAIARAILKDPPLLLLDEATSSLDAESERVVQQALDRLMVGRSTLVIAHRLATVLKADRILVIDQGRLVESGTHAQLVAAGGLYARLATLQFDQAAALGAAANDGARVSSGS
ncbi:ABC transporter transmembrane domain-containing protein [Pelagibius sp. 7325]|uniref:ABC transporter transmembrane domain-containing protein n=1 Tax=Pelagibius sp. 7325 TaxID=3131994 RepID=UPI0030EEAF0F